MEIKTKHGLMQYVIPIARGGFDKFVNCETCAGNGTVSITTNNKIITCPDCYGRKGSKQYIQDRWFVRTEDMGSIGKIDIDLYADKYQRDHKTEFRYMLDSTGVGSGSLWKEEDLFSTIEDATQECEKRNAVLAAAPTCQ